MSLADTQPHLHLTLTETPEAVSLIVNGTDEVIYRGAFCLMAIKKAADAFHLRQATHPQNLVASLRERGDALDLAAADEIVRLQGIQSAALWAVPKDRFYVSILHDDGTYDPPVVRDDLPRSRREMLFRHTVTQYVLARENYTWEGVNADYRKVSAMSAPAERDRYQAVMLDRKNPENPAVLHRLPQPNRPGYRSRGYQQCLHRLT